MWMKQTFLSPEEMTFEAFASSLTSFVNFFFSAGQAGKVTSQRHPDVISTDHFSPMEKGGKIIAPFGPFRLFLLSFLLRDFD